MKNLYIYIYIYISKLQINLGSIGREFSSLEVEVEIDSRTDRYLVYICWPRGEGGGGGGV